MHYRRDSELREVGLLRGRERNGRDPNMIVASLETKHAICNDMPTHTDIRIEETGHCIQRRETTTQHGKKK